MKRILLILLTLLLVFGLLSVWKIFGPSVSTPEGKFFYIKTGESFDAVKKELLEKKIIKNAKWFDWTAGLLKFKTVKAGKYHVVENSSLFNFLRMLKNGSQTPLNLIITKLRTKEDLAKKLGNLFEFDSLQAISFLNNADSLTSMDLDTNTVMTVVLPNTYTFFWNSTPEKVFKKLYNESLKFWTPYRKQKADSLGLTPQQVYILASIVEEETNIKADKFNIASVYLNRYKKGMKLESCPTIKYAMKNFTLTRIYDKYLQTESPYNTYRNNGLPPGPICTPQPETIDQVLNTPETAYLYFVANSDMKGGTIFTSDYKDHLKYAKEYQKAFDRQDSIKKANQ